jgi:hypothetical protein
MVQRATASLRHQDLDDKKPQGIVRGFSFRRRISLCKGGAAEPYPSTKVEPNRP